ncbi:DUF3014 domain-containing protein [Paracidovorax sp. MALMAid1276]|uniref:DUF3014 domain-containing protein n=1 Tax=Paracidovorax sp. MALMAid1276 TaxID=3411631 RepID=UPI003B9B0F9F
MPDRDTTEFRHRADAATPAAWGVAAVLLVGLAAAAALWWFWLRAPQPAAVPAVATAQAPAAPGASAAAPPPQAPASGPQNLVDSLAPADAALPALADSDARVAALLAELLGRDKVGAFLVTDGFVRRVVATVDNLGRAQAPARLWPVQPAAPRFLVEVDGDAPTAIAAANTARYSALLAFAEAVPLDAAVALYARLYPLFQQAYEELGYPRSYFNDRLVAVLGHLLLAPEPQLPPQVQRVPVNTALPDPRPWVRYEFTDPALQSLSSGQKILVRMGLANEVRAKALIRDLRKRVATSELRVPQR